MKNLSNLWVEWVEPYGPTNATLYCRMKAQDVVAVSRGFHPGLYNLDEEALDDFVTVNWATVSMEVL